MTLADINDFIVAGMDAYAHGGAGWEIQSDIVRATSFDGVDQYQGPGGCVFAWTGAARVLEGEHTNPFNITAEIPIFARGKFVGDLALLEANALRMTDDLTRALLIGDETPAGPVYGRMRVTGWSEPQIIENERSAHILIMGVIEMQKDIQTEL